MNNFSRPIMMGMTCLLLFVAFPSLGETQSQYFFRARVTTIVQSEQRLDEVTGVAQPFQRVRVELLEGEKKGQQAEIEYGGDFVLHPQQLLEVGDTVVLGLTEGNQGEYYVRDRYRLPSLGIILGFFVGLTIVLGGWRGVGSLVGLAVSGIVIIGFVVPRLAEGQDPITTSLLGAGIIVCLSLYLAHGFNKRANVALAGTLITLAIAAGLAIAFVSLSKLFGLGSEDALTLQLSSNAVNFRGLLLGGILLGTLGVLDDVTAGQAAAVDEIHRANDSLSVRELYWRGISVGREHIAALVNTLVLAYAGISLPLFLLFTFYGNEPIWVTLNSEYVAEEVVRTLVGSSAIILAVPITTFIAAYVFGRAKHK
jgi:uncharacterized membrane protein